MIANFGFARAADDEMETLPSRPKPEPYVLADYSGRSLRPGGLKVQAAAQCALAGLLAEVHDGFYRRHREIEISEDDRAAFGQDGSSLGADTYGELMPEGLLHILWKVGAKPGDRFYDLGAGTGKLVAIAWLLGLSATGIELSRKRWEASCAATKGLEDISAQRHLSSERRCLQAGSRLDYICGSLLELDFTDANIVFLSSVMFSRCMLAKIARLARWMKPGARIVSFHDLTRLVYGKEEFHFPEFRILGECTVHTSWKEESTWLIHEVVCNPVGDESGPQNLRRPDEFDETARRVCECSGVTF